jgi:hypothetical protein
MKQNSIRKDVLLCDIDFNEGGSADSFNCYSLAYVYKKNPYPFN